MNYFLYGPVRLALLVGAGALFVLASEQSSQAACDLWAKACQQSACVGDVQCLDLGPTRVSNSGPCSAHVQQSSTGIQCGIVKLGEDCGITSLVQCGGVKDVPC